MNQRNASMTVVDAGSYSIALTTTLARNGHEVVLWGHDPEHIATLEHGRCNAAFLPDVPSPDTLRLEGDLTIALAANRSTLVAVFSHVFGGAPRQIRPLVRPDACLVWTARRLEVETGRLLQDVVCEALGDQVPLATIPGPALAKELVTSLPAAISLASTDQTFTDGLQQPLHCGESFRIYSNPDLTGVQLGGAVKNVTTIGVGMLDGIGFGANACTTLTTRGLVEMSRLGAALGIDPATLMGIAGLGDLVFTCTDNQSRNCHFSMVLGQDMDVRSAQEKIGQVVEGYCNTKEVHELVHRFDVEMPMIEEIYQVLYCGKSVHEVVLTLLGCARKDERSSH